MIRHISLLIALTLSATALFAQPDAYHTALAQRLQNDYGLSGGSWLLPPNENTWASNSTSYGCVRTDTTVTGQMFSRVARLDVPVAGTNPWNAGFGSNAPNAIASGDRVLLCLWLRVRPGTAQPGVVNIYAEDAVSFSKEIYPTAQLDERWELFLLPFEASDAYPAGDMNLGLHLAIQAQEIEVAGFNALNFGKTVPLSALPTLLPTTYAGSEPNAPWRAAARARIDQHRKAALSLRLVDGSGNPLDGASVRVEMLRHDFEFGTAVVPQLIANNGRYNPTYEAKLRDLDGRGHGFNSVVPENAAKWRAWEQGWAGPPAQTVRAFRWLDSQRISVRGHVLLWPGWQYMPPDMQNNAQDPSYLRQRIFGHLDTILRYPGIGETVREWDAINEIGHVRDLENALAGKPGYATGREIYAEVLEHIKTVDPTLKLYLNDYEILSYGTVTGPAYQRFKSFIDQIIAEGGEVDGIGFQSHMGSLLIPPDSLNAILTDCQRSFNLPIKITEYDLPGLLPDSLQAQYLGDFLTLIFSHEAVDGFLMWGFWDGAHWKDNAPLFYRDWRPKPALATFNDLVFGRWWTDTTLTADADGRVALSGFKGDYRITVDHGGTSFPAELPLVDATDTTLRLGPASLRPAQNAIEFELSPNPATGEVSIAFSRSDHRTLRLLDLRGKVLLTRRTLDAASTRLDLSPFAAGVYLVEVQERHGARGWKRLVRR